MRIGIYPDQAQAIKGVLIWGKTSQQREGFS